MDTISIEPYPGDVPLAGDNAVTATNLDGLLKILATVKKRFGNTAIRYSMSWGGSALQVHDGQKQEIAKLHAWIDDLQSGMYVNCVYCGHRYGPADNVQVSMADVLKQHIVQCPEHLMSHLRDAIQEIIDTNGCSCYPTCTLLFPFCMLLDDMKKAIEASCSVKD